MSTQNSEKAITEADVLITAALADRPARQPDFAAHNQALHTLVGQLTDTPHSTLKTLVRIAQDLCRADTVGVSLLETLDDGTSVFRWVAIAGALESLEQTTTPGNFSPCGTTIDCGTPQLYARPELYFTYLHHPQFPIFEGLLFPICVGDRQLGTIWIISHNEQHQFDREDLRLMTSITGFTATALQSIHLRQTAELALGREQAARLETEAIRQALDEAAQQTVDILESITDAVVCLDPEWRITYVNQAVVKLNNLQQSEMIGKTHWEVWPWSVGTIVEQTYRQVIADQVPAHFEVFYKPLMMWLEIHAYPAGAGLSLYFRDITDRKQAESALRQSEERYRTLFESIDEAFAVIEMLFDENDKPIDYRFLEVNPAFEKQTGLQQATGKTARQLVSSLEDHWVEIYGKVALTGESLRFENGSEAINRWFDAYAFRIGQPHERKVAILFKDISDCKRIETEREQAKKALLLSEDQSRNVLESITDGFFALDRDWLFTYANQTAAALLDRTPDQLIGKNFWSEFPGLNSSELEQLYWRVMNDGVTGSLTAFYPDHDRWYEVHSYPAANGITIYFRNVTESKRVEEELRQKNAILEVINQSAPTPIFVKDREGRIIYANPATLEVLGKSASEVIGYRDCELYPSPELGEIVGENDRRIMASGQTEVVEESPDGIRTFLGMKAAYRNEAGVVIGLIGISYDISDRKRIESEREQILEREQAAREVAENANRIKDEFLAVLSHELRSPLNPILGWSQLLRRGKLDKVRTTQALETIERNAQLQSQLIEDLLDVSRIMRGKLTLVPVPVNLSVVISAAIETVRVAAEAKSIQIEVNLQPNIRQVYGDAGRLQQVVWNLLSNAVKFTPTVGRVTVRLTQTNHHVQLQVMDTGKGIKSEFLPYVFEHFRQEDGATTRKFGGLGLGLAIARQITELHGGRIWAESRGENQGATFTVELPVLPTANLLEEVTDTTEAEFDDLLLANLHVLIVDDEPDSLQFVAFVVKEAGAEVTAVGSASEALQLLSTTPFDILLSDIGMPEIDGYALIREIRQSRDDRGRQIPAIALTAYAGESEQQEAIASGFQSHLAKPADPEKIVTVIARMCGRKGGAK